MAFRTLLPALAAAQLCATALSGCLTPHVKPPLSTAIGEARVRAGAKSDACATGGLETISPADLDFAFDVATVTELGGRRRATAVQWLARNAGVAVVIRPDADHHGDKAHLDDLAQRRGQTASALLRTLDATAIVVRLLPRGGGGPVTAPHLVINAQGRGW